MRGAAGIVKYDSLSDPDEFFSSFKVQAAMFGPNENIKINEFVFNWNSFNLQVLQCIQNRAVKNIFRPQFSKNLIELDASKSILKVKDRLKGWFISFIIKGLIMVLL
jgi:hypothetical protein